MVSFSINRLRYTFQQLQSSVHRNCNLDGHPKNIFHQKRVRSFMDLKWNKLYVSAFIDYDLVVMNELSCLYG